MLVINQCFGCLILVAFLVFLAFQQQQQGGASGDQESGPDAKTLAQSNFTMDAGLEDKICDLYDLFVDVHKIEP